MSAPTHPMTRTAASAPATTTVVVRAPRRSAPVVVCLGAAAALGLAGGALTEVGQGALPAAVAFAANSVAAWMGLAAASTAVALLLRGPVASRPRGLALAVAAGAVAMEGLVAGYYLWAHLVTHVAHQPRTVAFWALAAVAGGPLAGAVAWGWRSRGRWTPAVSAALLSAVFVAEGLRAAVTMPWYRTSGIVEVVVGVALLLLVPVRAQGRAALLLAATSAWWGGCLLLVDRLLLH